MTEEDAEELFRQVAAFAIVRVRQVACRGVRPDRLRVVVPQAVLPGPVPGRADQRPADGLLSGRGPRQRHEAPRRRGPAGRHQRVVLQDHHRVGRPARRAAAAGGGIEARPEPVVSSACVVPSAAARERWTPRSTAGLGRAARAAPREGHRRAAPGSCSMRSWRGGRTEASSTSSSGPTCPRRSSNGSSGAARWTRWAGRGASCCGSSARWRVRHAAGWTGGRVRALGRAAGKRGAAAGRPMDLRLPATDVPALPPITESERIGDAYAVLGVDARAPGRGPVPAALDAAGGGDQCVAGRSAARPGPGRRAGRDPAAPDDREGHGLPRARGRDRDGQRHALADRPGSGCAASSGATPSCWSTGSCSGKGRS